MTAEIIQLENGRKKLKKALDFDIECARCNVYMTLDELTDDLQLLESLLYQKGINNKEIKNIFNASIMCDIDRGSKIGYIELNFKEAE